MRMTTKLVFICAMTCMFWLVPAQAQESEGVATAVTIKAKAGHEELLIKAITEYHHWVANFEGHMEYNWFRILTGPNTGSYVARSGDHNWADFDAEYDWQEEAAKVFASNIAPHIESAENVMTVAMDDFSSWPESFEGYSHFSVENWYVKNGQNSKFRKGLKTIVDTLKAGNYANHWGFYSVASGGYGGQIGLVTANKGWADFSDVDPSFYDLMTKELGSAEAFDAFMADWGSTFKVGKKWTVSRMPEASDYGK